MKVTIEKVEKLVERADVSYEVARDALEAADGNLLDAVIALEREGKLGANAGRKAAAYSTGGGVPAVAIGQTYGEGTAPEGGADPNFTFGGGEQARAHCGGGGSYSGGTNGQNGGAYRYKDESTAFEDNIRRFGAWLGRVFRAGVVNMFEVWRRGERIVYFPVILFLFCLIPWVFWLTLIILIIGLFCGSRYQFSGPNLGKRRVNDAMDRAADFADEMRSEEPQGGESGGR